jgi:YscO-like protein
VTEGPAPVPVDTPGYRLQALLLLHEREEEAAQQALADALHGLERAREALRRCEEALALHRSMREARSQALLEDVLRHGGGAGGLARMHAHTEALRRQEALLEEERACRLEAVVAAEQGVAARREALAGAVRERQALPQHREAWERQVRAERARREELAQDEVASALQQRRPRRGE